MAADGPAIRAILLLAPVAAFLVGLAATFADQTPTPGEIATMVVVPSLAGLFVILGRSRPAFLRLAALGLNIEAILAGCFVTVGLAFAVVLPLVGVGLVQPQLRGRQMVGALVSAGVAAVAGVAAAVLVGPARGLFVELPALLPIAGFATVVVLGLGLQWRASRQLFAALGRAEQEIAARDKAEAELDRTSEILSAIVRSSPVATQAFGMDRKVTIWNPASERTFGWTADEVVGGPLPAGMTPPDEQRAAAARIHRTIEGHVTSGERVRRMTKDGDERWIDIYAAPLRDRRGRAIGIAGQLVDVTERVQLEAQLLHAQKMEAIGLLASGLAHDFNNTLTVARGYAALIEAQTGDAQVRADAEAISTVVEKANDLTRRLLAVGRESGPAGDPVDVRNIVTDLAPLLRKLLGSRIEVEVDIADQPMVASIDVGQLEQALINLAVNARDAMADGGTLTIGVGRATSDGSFVEVVVRDTGTGIPPEVLGRIFEPFYTTKDAGKGSGLGLSMVSGFAARAGGNVAVESQSGVGTTFAIRFPAAAASEPQPLPPAAIRQGATGSDRPVRTLRPGAPRLEPRPS
ncbi:MAG: two-component system sensor histidine kinase NtrB [Chloroflexota bacterium]